MDPALPQRPRGQPSLFPMPVKYPSQRPQRSERAFVSEAVEEALSEARAKLADAELAWLFENCFPNTLDTTVSAERDEGGKPNTFVITGDIDAMWLRDSTNQVWPYLRFARGDEALSEMLAGLVRRQARCVRLDPYANAFYKGAELGKWQNDKTEMQAGVHERKYELDSLCAFFRLSCGYHDATGDSDVFDADWLKAVDKALEVIEREQAGSYEGPESPYRFQRKSLGSSDTLALGGRGNPRRRCGMSRSPFRPSDDATIFPYLVPANAMAVVCLRQLADLLVREDLGESRRQRAARLAEEIDAGIQRHGVVEHATRGQVYAYEVDGYGSALLMDDGNVPSLLSLPYLGYVEASDPVYRRSRAVLLSDDNPYFRHGTLGQGIGGPHGGGGVETIWPMAVIMQAMTSESEEEILACLRFLKRAHADTGFMHETVDRNDATRFTRSWFAWANSLFGELVLELLEERPELLGREIE